MVVASGSTPPCGGCYHKTTKLMKVNEIQAKSVLNKTGIPGFHYCLNPYTGCTHRCLYCYASFITERFRPRAFSWGEFLDAKINAGEILAGQLNKAKKGPVYLSSVTDCYQAAEAKYKLTRSCLLLLKERQFPVTIQTKSPLVLRDLDVFLEFQNLDIGITVTTDIEKIRLLFEPGAPTIAARIEVLRKLKQSGIVTYAFAGPILPMNPDKLLDLLTGCVDQILLDRMNYQGRIKWLYKKYNLQQYLEDAYFEDVAGLFEEKGSKRGIEIIRLW